MLKQSQLVSSLSQLCLLIIILTLTACADVAKQPQSQPALGEQSIETPEKISPSQNPPLQSLDQVYYADAKADANLAIAREDFQFLATSNRKISLPGIDLQKNSLEELEQQCGYRFLAGMGDTVGSKREIQLRKTLHRYATEYNQLMFIACQGGTL
jgi:hypothetical protein